MIIFKIEFPLYVVAIKIPFKGSVHNGFYLDESTAKVNQARLRLYETGCWILDTGCWMLGTGFLILDSGQRF
jgi:hypothetical protein